MLCYVYRSSKKADTYLYLPQKDDFSHLPDALLSVFGKPVFALKFELTPDRKLAAADAEQVLSNLTAQGYYLQIPPVNEYPV